MTDEQVLKARAAVETRTSVKKRQVVGLVGDGKLRKTEPILCLLLDTETLLIPI